MESKQHLTFRSQHRPALAKLLRPARDKCKQLCRALHLPYSSGDAGTKTEDLYLIVIETIIKKGVSKCQLADALRSDSVGYGNLAEEFEANASIKDNKDGKD